jgi:hypothetical protein
MIYKNDVGMRCNFANVHVIEFCAVETYLLEFQEVKLGMSRMFEKE